MNRKANQYSGMDKYETQHNQTMGISNNDISFQTDHINAHRNIYKR